ncbi:magnesium transporter CorA family protein [Curtobacterium ammoniigenes]|uniref:magnesium transporter CorA family protein n=1 Tax=Curtobacterium ammoniigenes TaxID=395387 RepID=UPI00082A44D3|nr:magnesium transporter CorA family protein [Curtobacterium ammoniigenes]
MVRTRVWKDGGVHDEDFDIERVSDWIEEAGTFVWVDFTDPTSDDLATIEDELDIHELAAEDAVERGQRPKLDRYADHMFLVAYDITCPRSDEDLVTHEVKAFVTDRALVTMHSSGFDPTEFVRRWDTNAELAEHGVPFLVWGMLDVLVDHAAATMNVMDDLVAQLEDELFADDVRGGMVQRRSFTLRKALGTVRRLTAPMRDVVAPILRGGGVALPSPMHPYFRDVADHVAGVADAAEQLRDAVASVLDTNLNLSSHRQNTVMKKVTSWAAIIAIPTAITGFFGQNVRFPGEGAWTGLEASLGLIVLTSVGLYVAFRRRDWL